MYGWDIVHLVVDTLITYFFIRFFGRKLSAFWILILTVSHLSALHIKRMIVDYGGWELDYTTIYMMSICKFSQIAFSYEDGGKSDDEIKSSYHRSK
jgi:lysophospholipid acyltransferase